MEATNASPTNPTLPSGPVCSSRQRKKNKERPFRGMLGLTASSPEARHQGVFVFLPTGVRASCLQSHPFYCWTGGETKLAKVPLTTAGLPCNPS